MLIKLKLIDQKVVNIFPDHFKNHPVLNLLKSETGQHCDDISILRTLLCGGKFFPLSLGEISGLSVQGTAEALLVVPIRMVVESVHLEADAYMVCLTHALSTEREEVMGLLIGEVDENRVLHIFSVIMLRRSDKQPDRVEISPEQLSDASSKAERLAQQYNRPLRVLGWYHSHPHITVWPSHVDVRTQAMYQMMDEGFIGLIFSVFNEDKSTKSYRHQLTCFQSINQAMDGYPPQYARVEVPLHIVPSSGLGKACLESLIELPMILCQEEEEEYKKATADPELDLITKLQNSSVFTKSLCHIMEVMHGPLIQSLESRLEQNNAKIAELEKRQAEIQKLIDRN